MNHSNLLKVQVARKEEEFTPDKVSTGALSKWLETEEQRLRVVMYPTGYEADHVCYDGHAFYVVSGSIKIEMGEELTEWQTGDAFIIPDEVPHRVLNPFDDDAQVVVVDHG
ncbi:cupin domain-containing protein [Siminovitchia sp. 179-K 8D1 HS]|uniref:cupin domain-containing protein n=1 Tax=Siminovitchia sp. 179-K 8D1 HS TaxID=3142385 RepID=UPI0039A1480F